jgi:peroxiredoxin
MVEVGERAPEFVLPDQHGQRVRLSSFSDRRDVILVFYPYSFTGVCGGELLALNEQLSQLQNDRVQLLAVSVDSMFSQRAFAEQQGLGFPLLADFWPHGEVARAYGVFDEKVGAALRGTFVIDKQGVVRWSVRNAIPDARDITAYHRALATL